MAEADRIAAALAYQEQMPAMLNPNLARQGARGRANMMPPTSIMDERYPAFKRNQEDVEKLMLGVDLVGSAIPLAGPAMKGAKVLGQHAAPQLAQALENYAFKTGMALPMDVWHGSPHRFAPTAKNPLGEFNPTKIGTGEGAQAYGYGHYLAEQKDIAKSYANDVAGMFAKPESSLYKVDLPDEVVPRMLDWDAKFESQHPDVQAAILKYWADNPGLRHYGDPTKMTGEEIYGSAKAANLGPEGGAKINLNPSNEAASMDLRYYGIPGIKYLDAASRGASTGTRNFVVFPGNEGLLNILGRE